MNSRTLEQWVALYNKKIPEGFKRDERFVFFFDRENGFSELMDAGLALAVNQTCGDFKYWFDFAVHFARRLGRGLIVAPLNRTIRPYLRLGGFEIERTAETSLGTKFFCRQKETGRQGIAYPSKYKSNVQIYYFVMEVNANGVLF